MSNLTKGGWFSFYLSSKGSARGCTGTSWIETDTFTKAEILGQIKTLMMGLTRLEEEE